MGRWVGRIEQMKPNKGNNCVISPGSCGLQAGKVGRMMWLRGVLPRRACVGFSQRFRSQKLTINQERKPRRDDGTLFG